MNGPGTRYRHRRPREEHGPAAALHISRCCGACGAASFGYGCASIHGMRTEQTRRGEGPCRTRACQFGRSRRASGMPRIFLQVEDNNEAALALYRRAGFETLWGMSTGADSFRPATSAAAHVER